MSINLNSLQDKWFSQKKVDKNGDSKISKKEMTTYGTQAAQKNEIDRTPDEELAIKFLKPSDNKEGKSFFDLASKLDGAADLSANDLTSFAAKDGKIDKLSRTDFNKLKEEKNTEAIQASNTPTTASAKASASANKKSATASASASVDNSTKDTTQNYSQQKAVQNTKQFSFLKSILNAINKLAKNQNKQKNQACSKKASNQSCSETSTGSTTGTTNSASGTSGLGALPDLPAIQTGNNPAALAKLRSEFDKKWESKWHAKALAEAKSGTSHGQYANSIIFESLTAMYKATGDKKYVTQALEIADAYKSSGKDKNGDGYVDYGRDHEEWRGAAGVSNIIGLIKTDPSLKEFDGKANELTAFIEKNCWEKWKKDHTYEGNGPNGTIYTTDTTHMNGRLGVLALNLYRATGKQEYKDYIDQVSKKIRDHLVRNSDGSVQPSGAIVKGFPATDPWHAGDTVSFMVQAYRAGMGCFDKNDIDGLIKTAKKAPNGRYREAGWACLTVFDKQLWNNYNSDPDKPMWDSSFLASSLFGK